MSKLILISISILILILLFFLMRAPLYAEDLKTALFFDENDQPTTQLRQLLELVGMEPLCQSETVIVQINHWAQKNLLRQGERWQEQTDRFEKLKPQIKPLLTALGFVNSTSPHFNQYQGAIVHGSLLSTVRLRLQYLIEQWKQGIRFHYLYFFSSDRPLEPQKESKHAFTSGSLVFPKTEIEMVQWLWENSEVPKDMRKTVKVHFIQALMKKDPNSDRFIRPTTDDTVEASG